MKFEHTLFVTNCTYIALWLQGEHAIAQKVLDRILDRSFYISDVYLTNNGDSVALTKSDYATRNSVTMGGNVRITSGQQDDEENENTKNTKVPGVENAVVVSFDVFFYEYFPHENLLLFIRIDIV